jgi:hypothetical protein
MLRGYGFFQGDDQPDRLFHLCGTAISGGSLQLLEPLPGPGEIFLEFLAAWPGLKQPLPERDGFAERAFGFILFSRKLKGMPEITEQIAG